MLLIPSLIAVLYFARKQRESKEMLFPLLFLSCYLLILLVKRPMFGYSALVLLPLAYLTVARATALFAQWCGKERIVYTSVFSASMLCGLYAFPLISERLVPLSLYRPILAITHIFGGP